MSIQTGEQPLALSREDLRALFLFADLTEEQLDWVRENGDVVAVTAGQDVLKEGEAASCFYVLLSGTISMGRVIGGDEVETVRTDQRGVYFGSTQFFLEDAVDQTYPTTVRAITDCTLVALPSQEFAGVFKQWFPM